MTTYIFQSVRQHKGKLILCTWERTFFGTLESTLMVHTDDWKPGDAVINELNPIQLPDEN